MLTQNMASMAHCQDNAPIHVLTRAARNGATSLAMLLPLLLPQLLLLLLLLLFAPSALLLDAALSVRTPMGTQHQNQNLKKTLADQYQESITIPMIMCSVPRFPASLLRVHSSMRNHISLATLHARRPLERKRALHNPFAAVPASLGHAEKTARPHL